MECFDRDEETERLWRLFGRGRDVLMLGPRRMGKTVLLERLEREAATRGFRAVIFDVEGYRDVKDFFRVMCSSIQEELGSGQALLTSFTERLRRAVRGAEQLDGDWRNLLLKTEWDVFADHLLGELDEAKGGKSWLFLVDEITIFTKALVDGPGGAATASDFLYKLRQLCRRHRKVRWLFTGSIGLDTIARRHGLEGALVDLEIFTLRPFDGVTAEQFLRTIAAANRTSFSDPALDRICTRLGWLSPYYLEKIAESACELATPGSAVDVATADLAADRLLDLATEPTGRPRASTSTRTFRSRSGPASSRCCRRSRSPMGRASTRCSSPSTGAVRRSAKLPFAGISTASKPTGTSPPTPTARATGS